MFSSSSVCEEFQTIAQTETQDLSRSVFERLWFHVERLLAPLSLEQKLHFAGVAIERIAQAISDRAEWLLGLEDLDPDDPKLQKQLGLPSVTVLDEFIGERGLTLDFNHWFDESLLPPLPHLKEIDAYAELADQIEAELAALKARKQSLVKLHDRAIRKLERWRSGLDRTVLRLNDQGMVERKLAGRFRQISIVQNPPRCEVLVASDALPQQSFLPLMNWITPQDAAQRSGVPLETLQSYPTRAEKRLTAEERFARIGLLFDRERWHSGEAAYLQPLPSKSQDPPRSPSETPVVEEPYDINRCTVRIVITLLPPDTNQSEDRPCLLAASTHNDLPVAAQVKFSELEPLPVPITRLLAQLRDEHPQRRASVQLKTSKRARSRGTKPKAEALPEPNRAIPHSPTPTQINLL